MGQFVQLERDRFPRFIYLIISPLDIMVINVSQDICKNEGQQCWFANNTHTHVSPSHIGKSATYKMD